jgi:type I restriction enzyme R subunit
MDLRLRLLQKLLEDKIAVVFRKNHGMSQTLKELLEKTICDYHTRVIQPYLYY